ncbi:hypothetical protein HMPREF9442_02202 [Paraprevotella xylaniphila YIT 11841]|uniref:Uncharacterized protein n=1 Tax=Paraprevotella xylaniphila YIT 11841 TaxID=762982 RepID=F3QVH6_9BACT|nr:hypothetical protein HMPREF9442_02202 [Paraprevotella xylaniphila YIT 11841]
MVVDIYILYSLCLLANHYIYSNNVHCHVSFSYQSYRREAL